MFIKHNLLERINKGSWLLNCVCFLRTTTKLFNTRHVWLSVNTCTIKSAQSERVPLRAVIGNYTWYSKTVMHVKLIPNYLWYSPADDMSDTSHVVWKRECICNGPGVEVTAVSFVTSLTVLSNSSASEFWEFGW